MTTTLIIGKDSNLSKALDKAIKNTVLISSRSILEERVSLEPYANQPVNIVLNNFQPATALNDVTFPDKYIEAAILSTSKVFGLLKAASLNVQQVVYTSSSSVYGDNVLCRETDTLKPLSLHAALKVANEKLVEKFCVDNNISFVITRVFNMYGGEDHFSIISKIILAHKECKVLPIVNRGNAIRDFIHIDDVVKIYRKLLSIKNTPPIINIGSGEGYSIGAILDFLNNHGVRIKVNTREIEEIKVSTACVNIQESCCSIGRMTNVKEYILTQIKSH